MSSLSGLDRHAAPKPLNVAFVLPKKYEGQEALSEGPYIFVEDLKTPSFIASGGLNINMQIDSIKDVIRNSPVLSYIFKGALDGEKQTPSVAAASLDQVLGGQEVATVEADAPTKFFRYSRGGDPKNEWRPKATGGLCFLIQLDPQNRQVVFSVSICHPRDRFERKVARKIAEHRFNGNYVYVLDNYDLEMPVLWNIKQAALNYLKTPEERDTLKPMLSNVPAYVTKHGNQEVRIISQRT